MVEGFITGLHKSPYHGFSVEFAEHRPYNPGDELRRVDWKVYAKTDRHYVKRYEEETNLRHYVVLDTSPSMRYRHAGFLTKLEYSAYLAAALHFLMVRQRDATGLIAYDERIHTMMRPKASMAYLRHILIRLDQLSRREPDESRTDTASALHSVADRITRRSLVVLITDLFVNIGTQQSLVRALRHLRHRGHEVLVFRVLESETERSFKFPDVPVIFRDMETQEEITLHPAQLRDHFSKAVQEDSEEFRRRCLEHNIDFVELDTGENYSNALLAYLNKRKRLL